MSETWVSSPPSRSLTGFVARRSGAALVLSAIFWLLAWYSETVQSMVAIWRSSDTFVHGFLIVPISVWMIWRRRRAIAALTFRADLRALPLLALAGFGWLVAQLAGAGVVQQYAMVAMIPLLVWAVLGRQVVLELAFPFFFLLFAVPFGEFLEPPLMEHTADFVVFALKLSGIPVYREGQFFMIPSGSWSVVEACSGLRYLIASLTVGVLYAYLTYRTLARRAIFVALSVIVPILANWLRAYMIVMIGHLSGMKYAVGFDHLIYGWVFFGVVMLLLFWIGSFWREDLDPHAAPPGLAPHTNRNRSSSTAIMLATIAAAGLVAVWPAAAVRLAAASAFGPPTLQMPPSAGAWQPVAERLTEWTPRFFRPSAQIRQAYGREASRVGLYVGYYRNQSKGAELISSYNTLVPSNDRVWRNMGESRRILGSNPEEMPIIEAKLRGQSKSLLVWRWYWVDGRHVVNPYWAKLLQANSRLLGRGDDSAFVIVYAPYDDRPLDAERVLQEFVGAMLPAITRSLEYARRDEPSS